MSTSTPVARFHQTYGHALRLAVRVHVGNFHREVDLSLPLTSAIAEVLPEILELAEAPQITRPWRASTVAGAALDMSAPLQATSLDHGHVLVLTPAEPVDAPIVRDSAEALVARTTGLGARGGVTAAALTAAAMTALLLVDATGPTLAVTAAAGLCAVTALWARHRHLLALAAVVLGGAAAGIFVAGESYPDDPTWTVLSACAAGAAGAVFFTAVGALPARLCAAVLTTLGLAGVAALFGGPATIVAGLVLLTAAPSLVTGLAGLEVPRLPTAGQDLSVADGHQADVDSRAARAQQLHDGVSAGAAAAVVPAVLTLGAGLAAQLLALAVAGATCLHAARHRPAVPAWALTAIGLSGLVAAALAAENRATVIVAAAAAALTISAVVFSHRFSTTSPTTAVWWERAELASVIAVLPLAAWAGGLFALIRGLG